MNDAVKLCVTVTLEYDADPANYGTKDPNTMAAIDQRNFEDDPSSLFDVLNRAEFDIKVEPS